MEENTSYTNEIEFDLKAIFTAVRDRIFLLILVAAAGMIITYLCSRVFITPTYDSTTKIYVLNRQNSDAAAITYSDLQSATQLTKDYMELVTTRPVLEAVISALELENISYEELADKISVSTATDGRIISIRATDENPQEAKAIADEVRNAVSAQIIKVMDVEAVNVVEEANLPEKKARPANIKNAVIGGTVALLVALVIILIQTVMDDCIKNADDVQNYLGVSVLGTIPMDEKKQRRKQVKKKKAKKKF